MPPDVEKQPAAPSAPDTEEISIPLTRGEWTRIIVRLQWDAERKRDDYALAHKIDFGLAKEVAKAPELPSRKTTDD